MLSHEKFVEAVQAMARFGKPRVTIERDPTVGTHLAACVYSSLEEDNEGTWRGRVNELAQLGRAYASSAGTIWSVTGLSGVDRRLYASLQVRGELSLAQHALAEVA